LDKEPGSSDPGSSIREDPSQRQQVLDLLHANPGVTDLQVSDLLQIPYSSAGTRLSELRGLGQAEPRKSTNNKKERARWWAVPPERQVEVAEQDVMRRRRSLLRSMQNQPVWNGGWVIQRLLAPAQDHEREEAQLQVDCPGVKVVSLCDCMSMGVWVTRHRDRRKSSRSRASRAANDLRRIRREHRLALEATQKEDPTSIQYLSYKLFVREAAVYLDHMSGFVEDEIEFKRDTGYSELTDQAWLVIREMVEGDDGAQAAIDRLKRALDSLMDDRDDCLEAEEVTDYDDGMEIIDAEVLELEPGD
jgi:hypothetical protein